MTTAIHRMVARCRAVDYPAMVTRLPSGWVVMAERQLFAGYCLLLPDPVVPHLNELSGAARERFLSDMAHVGDAVLAITAALRINYAVFGNVDPALHAHVIPRFVDEPTATRTHQPWSFDWTQAPEYSIDMYGDLQCRIAEKLAALMIGV